MFFKKSKERKARLAFGGGVYFANTVLGNPAKRMYPVFRIIAAMAGVFGVLFSFLQSFSIDISVPACVFACVIGAAPAVMASISKRNKGLIILAGAAFFLLWLFVIRHELIPGFLGIYNRIISISDVYYIMPPMAEINLSAVKYGGYECMLRVFYFVSAVISYFVFVFTVYAPDFILVLLATAPLTALSLYLKPEEPETLIGIASVSAGVVSAAAMQFSSYKLTVIGANPVLCRDKRNPGIYFPTNHHKTPAVSQIGALALALIFISGGIAALIQNNIGIKHISWYDVQDFGRRTEERLGKIAIGNTSDIIGRISSDEISLGRIDSAKYYNRVDLELTADRLPDEPVYLRCTGGCEYTGSSWEKFSDGLTEPYRRMFYEFEEAGYYPLIAGDDYGHKYFHQEKINITVKNKFADRTKAYLPYFSDLSSLGFRPEKDLYMTAGRKSEYSVDAYLLSYMQANMHQPEKMTELESAYLNYIDEMYLRLPESGLDKLRGDWASVKSGSYTADEKIRFVQYYLAAQAEYTRSPGKTPDGKDFVEYFLYESRKGYCTYFATSGVVILRELGVPARYAQGYVVFPKEWTEENGVYKAQALDRSAHAWAEVYLKGIGWVPVEMTPASPLEEERSEISAVTTPAESQTEPESAAKETEPQPEETMAHTTKAPAANETSVEASSETAPEIAPDEFKPPAALWAVIALALWAVIREIVLKLRLSSFKTRSRRKNILNMYRWFAAVSRALKLPLGNDSELPDGFSEKLAKILMEKRITDKELVSKGNIERFIALAWKADFSCGEISEEEERSARAFISKLRQCLKASLKPWQWFYLTWLLMLI